jgi:methionyl-tRNA formyltransferase|tara:strand:- start:741 stop:1730 length:990 start_codon:yes stop_codon:yes gene_type:complete
MKINIIFFGTGQFGAKSLLSLCNNNQFNVRAIVTQPKKKKGRDRKIITNDIENIADNFNIEILRSEKIDDKLIEKVSTFNPHIGILISSSHFLSKKLIDIFPYNVINVHPSLLPQYRGSSPMQSALSNGEKITGITIMNISNKLDAGPIIAQYIIKIDDGDNFVTLANKLSIKTSLFLNKVIHKYINKEITSEKQQEVRATYTNKIFKSNGKIKWKQNSHMINNQIRSLSGWPNSFTFFNNKQLIIHAAVPIQLDNQNIKKKIGIVCSGNNREYTNNLNEVKKIYATVRCYKSELIIEELQLENKKRMSIQSFINGNNNFINSTLNYKK